jgi:hypothetical protein
MSSDKTFPLIKEDCTEAEFGPTPEGSSSRERPLSITTNHMNIKSRVHNAPPTILALPEESESKKD